MLDLLTVAVSPTEMAVELALLYRRVISIEQCSSKVGRIGLICVVFSEQC